MNDDPRYASGTSLILTDKERWIGSLENTLRTEFDDEQFLALKKLPLKVIKQLHRDISDRLSS